MKKILIIASLALCCSLLASCEDFLDTKKYGAKTDWETQEDVEKALVALFSFNTNDSEGVTGRGITWFECCSDDMTVGRPQGEAEDIRNFRMSPSNGRDVKNNWKIMYEVNAKANNIIKVVPTMNLDNAFKTKATGTAYFFRGFAMLWLSPYYGDNGPNGGIPIILDTTEPAAMDSPRPASVLQNYDQIISDLREAGKRLPLFSQLAPEEYGMPHKAAAWALAARAALYAAQFDAKYYDTVIEMCDKVMGLTGADKRELFDDGTDKAFANLWRKQQNFGCEYIFSLLGNAVDGPKFHGMSFQNGGWGLYNHWGYFQPTLSLWNAFESGDTRRDATIIYPGQTIRFMGRDIVFGSNSYSISSDTGMSFRKFLSPWEEADCKRQGGEFQRRQRQQHARHLPHPLRRRPADESRGADLEERRRRRRSQTTAQPHPQTRPSPGEQPGDQSRAQEPAPLRTGVRVHAEPPPGHGSLGRRQGDLRQTHAARELALGLRPAAGGHRRAEQL